MDPQLSKSGKISGVWTPSLSLGGRCGRFLLILSSTVDSCATAVHHVWATEIGYFDNRVIWGLPANGGAGLTLNT